MKMKRIILIAVAAVSVLAVTGIGATAADGPSITQFRHLQRDVNRLESRVSGLQTQVNDMKRDVGDLLYDVFVCQFPGDPIVAFTDGSYGYSYYYDAACVSTQSPSKPGIQTVERARTP
jgi:hypothetical protein